MQRVNVFGREANNSMQRTTGRAAADAERWAAEHNDRTIIALLNRP